MRMYEFELSEWIVNPKDLRSNPRNHLLANMSHQRKVLFCA